MADSKASDLKPKWLSTRMDDFWQQLEAMLAFDGIADDQVFAIVREIIQAVKREQDQAVLQYTERFDSVKADSVTDLEISQQRLQQALTKIDSESRLALEQAAQRIRLYHEKQTIQSWTYQEADGTRLGQQVTALEKVGLYVPGGKAAYPSTLLMNAIPAKVAGVKQLVVTVPTPKGNVNDLVLAAAKLAGVDRVFAIGGAQAIAAMAYGTQTIPQVDKIVGPGNIYVATAKALVYGQVGIDMIAGPSEILVLADGSTDPEWIAMDLFSQAEHDEDAQSILICPDKDYIEQVIVQMNRLLPSMERAEIITKSINNRGAMIQVKDMDQATQVANSIAPEHLELSVTDPQSLLPKIRNAGAIFLGAYTCEALGDYCAGPNHVLPTSRTARFSSPLGVYDFQKRSSIIYCSAQGANELGRIASILAKGEGLTAHAKAADYRRKDE